MGWTFNPGSTLKSQIASLSRGWENDEGKTECLAKQFKGNVLREGVLWMVWQRTNKETGEQKRFIICCLLEYSRKDEGWGYKDMDENSHPFYYNCPLKYLKMVPEHNDGVNLEWREKVKAHHEERRAKRAAKKKVA